MEWKLLLEKEFQLLKINQITFYEPWFLEQIQNLVNVEDEVRKNVLPTEKEKLNFLKKMDF